jgi:cell division protein FtsI/penicillin-binding protein 2
VPREIDDVAEIVQPLHEVTGLDPAEIINKIGADKDDPYQPIAHHLDKGQADRIREMNLKGIRLQPESVRFYPNSALACHLLGYVGYDMNNKLGGVTGLEKYYETELAGQRGELQAEKDARGQWLPVGERTFQEAQDGSDLVLTIDRTIQFKAEEMLKEAVEKHSADNGSVLIMDPRTGEIIALANYPNYDPNNYQDVEDIGVFNNSAIFDRYEPGSTFKVLQVAAGIDSQKITPETTFNDSGSLQVGSYTITNYENRSYGELTVTQAIEKSDNVVMAQVAQTLGVEVIDQYLDRFGLRKLTGIDVAQETENYIKPEKEWKDIDVATSGFGQGVTVTPIQLMAAVASLANNGKMMQPHVVKEIRHPDGQVEKIEPQFVQQTVQGRTALSLVAIMRSSVKNGFAKPADVPGYEIAGKTGTAQVASADRKGYDPNKKIVSFIGFPAGNLTFVMLVKIDNPKGPEEAGVTVAAPMFRDLAKFIFAYQGIPPTE